MKNKKYNLTILVVLTLVLLAALTACSSTIVATSQAQQRNGGFQNTHDTDITIMDEWGNTSIDPVN